MKITVLIADDHQEFRRAVRSQLDSEPGIEVIGEAADGDSAVELAASLRPDVVLMDIVMPVSDGIIATRLITAALPTCRVLGVTIHTDRALVDEMLAAGAWGVVHKTSAGADLAAAVLAIASGEMWVGDGLG